MSKSYDFSGYATKNDLECADGRTIRKNAFKECDGVTVPLVWQHSHGKPGDVLGHAVLENREDGVYTYGFFNNTESGKNAKELVRHGDVRALSIYANQLVQKGKDVLHGMIREVSLCLAGANPGAFIEDLSFEHFDDEDAEFEAQIWNGDNIELYHSDSYEPEEVENDMDNKNPNVQEAMESMNDDQREVMIMLVDRALKYSNGEEDSESDEDFDPAAVSEVLDTYDDDQMNALEYAVGEALKHGDDYVDYDDDEVLAHSIDDDDDAEYDDYDDYDYDDDDDAEYDDYDDYDYDDDDDAEYDNYDDYDEEDSEMKHNAFDGTMNGMTNADAAELMHDAMHAIIDDGPRFGSLRESFNFHAEDGALAHAIDTTGMDLPEMSDADYAEAYGYGFNDPSMLYPEARSLNSEPEFIKRKTDWADEVWNGVHRTPFSRIKSVFANITEDEARAKGYLKGNMKKEEFFSLMKRVTVPVTVYKKQKIDRDDITDITSFDVVRWIRSEMRVMWNEETARAMLIGDGRPALDSDKISEEHIRPIANDAPLFSIQTTVQRGQDESATAKNFIRAAVKARKNYLGSGNPTLFTTEDQLTSMLLIEDGIGHYIYKSEAELATALRVKKIVTVPVMEGHTLKNGNELLGIIVNLEDYNVGTDKGGEVSIFDDFDIDFNQYKYLIESRCSGALIRPYSAIVLSIVPENNNAEPAEPDPENP